MLQGTRLSKRYGNGATVLNAVDVNIEPGEIVALLGANGCGKSTLLRALALVDPADEGEVVIDNVRHSAGERVHYQPWPTVTMVFQQLFLWPHLTVRRNIAFPQSEIGDVGAEERFEEVVRMFRLRDLVDRYPNEISLGQRQRVALARALAVRPRYLLLDEVTSALDIEHTTALLGYLKDLAASGIGIVLVTHLIGFARSVADRVLFMADGGIVEQGDASILTRPSTPQLARFLSIVDPGEKRSGRAATERAS